MKQKHYGYLPITEEFLSDAKKHMLRGELTRLILILIPAIFINLFASADNSFFTILQVIIDTAAIGSIIGTLYNVIALKKLGIKQLKKAIALDGAYVEKVGEGLIVQTAPITNKALNDCAIDLINIYESHPDKLPLIKKLKSWVFSEDTILRIKAVIYTEVITDQLAAGNIDILETEEHIINFKYDT